MSPVMYRRLEEEAWDRQEAGDDLEEQPSGHENPVPPILRPDAFTVERPQLPHDWGTIFSATLAANLATTLVVALEQAASS
jgi:hypothetical protein